MKRYTLTQLGNKSGEIVEAAHKAPVDLTSRGKRKFVLMSAEHYDRLTGQNTQTVHHIDTMSAEEIDELLEGLDRLIEEQERDDG